MISSSFHARVVVAILWHVCGCGVGFGVELYVCKVGADEVVIGLLRCWCGFRWEGVIYLSNGQSWWNWQVGGFGDDCYHRLVTLVVVRWNV
jgi:hypothetical protein